MGAWAFPSTSTASSPDALAGGQGHALLGLSNPLPPRHLMSWAYFSHTQLSHSTTCVHASRMPVGAHHGQFADCGKRRLRSCGRSWGQSLVGRTRVLLVLYIK